jgi:outer membrane protein OmpA-like peptidoglycan-associated protein
MIRVAAAVLLCASAAAALDLPAGARVTSDASDSGGVALAAGPARDGAVHFADYRGLVTRRSWSVPGERSTFELMDPLRRQLEDDGYRVTVSCETRRCGGFDFRFAAEVLPEPAMHVDLGDFRYLLAEKLTDAGVAAVSLMVSRSASAGYVQMIAVAPGEAAPETVEVPEDGGVEPGVPLPAAPDAGTLGNELERSGFVVLGDLAFDTGSATLGDAEFASLDDLAAYLKGNPERTVAIVGHTDSVGSTEANLALSRRRALAVMERLIERNDVPRAQLQADGVGFLSPRASNLTQEGRELNRRVEVVLTSTE